MEPANGNRFCHWPAWSFLLLWRIGWIGILRVRLTCGRAVAGNRRHAAWHHAPLVAFEFDGPRAESQNTEQDEKPDTWDQANQAHGTALTSF